MAHIQTLKDREIKEGGKTYTISKNFPLDSFFTNAEPVLAGSIFKECNDGWFQSYDANGNMLSGRYAESKILKYL